MKKYRPLIIAAIVLVVILAAYLLIVMLTPEQQIDTSADSQVEKTTYVLTDYELTDVDYMKFTYHDGYEYVIDCVVTYNDAGVASRNYFIEGKSQYDYDRNALGMAAMNLADISTTSYVEENPKDIAKYGLDDPYVTFEIADNGGNKSVVHFGDANPRGSGSYAIEEGGDKVYNLGSYVSEYLIRDDKSYRTLTVTNYADYTAIKHLLVSQPGKETIEMGSRTADEMAAIGLYASQFYFTQPIEREANDTTLAEEILPSLLAISAYQVVEDSVDNLSEYGLDGEDVTVIEITDAEDVTKKLTLSAVDENGYRYGVISGVMSVYQFDSSIFDAILNMDYREYINKLIWLHTITDVGTIELNIKGEKHVLELFDPTPEEEEAGKVFEATFNGGEIVEDNVRRLFARVHSPTFYDMIEGEVKPVEIEYEFKIIYDEEDVEDVLQFAPINDRQYIAYLNGEATDYYVNVNDLKAIEKAIETIEKGDILSMY